jgi:outer membrane protein assembly factor BamE (lipoprotein component of BamABCDE complex)
MAINSWKVTTCMTQTTFLKMSASRAGLSMGLGVVLLLTSLSGCAPTITKQGYLAIEADPAKDIKVGEPLAVVEEKLGSPSQISTFEPNIWYYIDQTTMKMTYHNNKVIQRNVTVIEFNKNDQTVASVKTLTLADSRDIIPNLNATPTRGRSMTALEQILGTVGRQTLPNDNDKNPGSQRRRE